MFGSVAATAAECGIPVIFPADANAAGRRGAARSRWRPTSCSRSITADAGQRRCWHAAPRRPQHAWLAPAEVPRPRAGQLGGAGGERETGATLHYMTAKPMPVTSSLSPPCRSFRTTAREVFDKVTVAAETMLDRLPPLVAGNAPRAPQDLTRGSTSAAGCRGRRIDWRGTRGDP